MGSIREITPQSVVAAAHLVEESALAPETMPAALEEAAQILGVHSFYLMRLGGLFPHFVINPSQAECAGRYQSEGWWQIDDRTQRNAALAARRGGIVRDQDAVPEDIRKRSQIFNEFYRDEGVDWCAGWTLELEGETWAWAVQRASRVGAITDEESAALALMAPALSRAAVLGARMQGIRATGAAEGLASAGHPTIVLDHRGMCCFATPSAETAFDAQFGLKLGKLWAADAASNLALAELSACASGRLLRLAPPTVTVNRGDGRRPVLVLPVPLRGLGRDAMPSASLVLMLVDLEARPAPPQDMLKAVYGLTRAEAQIAMRLAAAESPEAISEAMGLQLATVRTAVKVIFGKTDTHRQAELAVLLNRIPSPARG
jgi:DNA-binding CsgD family transcriptional regulator